MRNNLDNISAMINGDIPMTLNQKGEYVMDIAKYKQMMKAYESKRKPIHFHTFDSVVADIFKERAKGRYYAQ